MDSFSALSEPVKSKLRKLFPASAHEAVATLLLKYNFGREIERIQLDILEICDSSLDKVQRLVTLANQDYRDLICAAEYDLIDGKPVLKPQFAKRRTD
jgi:hypothetical protein